MDQRTKQIIASQMGALHITNIELKSLNDTLIGQLKALGAEHEKAIEDKDKQIAILKSELERWQSKAKPADTYVDKFSPEGAEANGAGVH
jgi:hypothetical protein